MSQLAVGPVLQVDPGTLLNVLLNGVSFAMILFLIAAGLSLIFGVMGIVNFAHGALYALGGYVAVTVVTVANNFWLALLVAPLAVAAVGVAMEYTTLRPLYDREDGVVFQLLLTFGIAIMIEQGIIAIWGTGSQSFPRPEIATGTLDFGLFIYPKYNAFIILMGALLAVLLWLFITKTRFGVIVQAGTTDRKMAEALGVNIDFVFTSVFALGSAIAAAGAIFSAPLFGVYPAMGADFLIQAFVVVVVGGLGSLSGSFFAAMVVGIIWAFVSFYFEQFAGFTLFATMIVVLIVRPYGLLGDPEILED